MDLELKIEDGRNEYEISTQIQPLYHELSTEDPAVLHDFVSYQYGDIGSSSDTPLAPVVSNVSIRCISEHVPSMQEYFTGKS